MAKSNGYPDSLRIGDRTYKVRFVKSIRGCKRLGKGSTVGMYDPSRIEILIKAGMSKDDTLKTMLHEALHAIEFEYDIRISHKGIYAFKEALFDFICANDITGEVK
jgi:hypothetical protein